ncbi:thioredoxin domain-containing protein [Malonomonas rubra]|uniref:DsbA family protein n=1 Tax=Malonomonas rubra TaxID=57040 RepID=UPI0026F0530B|nr:thioredoxin domain-containing protein [Malonomonas rubra]
MLKLLLPPLLLLFGFSHAFANDVEVRMLRTVGLAETPKQVVATGDGQRFYVLTEAGEVQLFSGNGDLLGSFDAGPEVTNISPQGSNRLILEKGKQKQLMLVALEPIVQISTEGSPVLGPADAPVTIVIFDDFECPYCAKALPLVKEVVNAYQEQVKLVFKHFPLAMHRNARAAAVASIAAEEQGKFWPLHDLLFANYSKLSPQKITELAKQAGLDMERFEKDRKDPRLQQKITEDQREGQQIGVRGTPTIFINGRLLPQRSRAAFDQLIRAELTRAKRENK